MFDKATESVMHTALLARLVPAIKLSDTGASSSIGEPSHAPRTDYLSERMASRNAFSALRYISKPISSSLMTRSFLDCPVRCAYVVMRWAGPCGSCMDMRMVCLAPTLGLYTRLPVILRSWTCFWNPSFRGRPKNLGVADRRIRTLSRSAVSQPSRSASRLH